ncbi:MAG: protein ImuB [Acidobacteriota bacterium]|jgi:protein ImuB|nr:protein ImuB [Acidobacteriota bacterium]
MYACVYAPQLVDPNTLEECALSFSPSFEKRDANTIVFGITGLRLLYPQLEEIPRAIRKHFTASTPSVNIAIAHSPDAAVLVARHFNGITIISEGSAKALENLSVKALTLSPEIAEAFDLWGIHTFRDIAELPEAGMVARLGPQAVELQQMASGLSRRPLLIEKAKEVFEDRVEFDEAIELLEPLLFVLGRSLGDLCQKLRASGMAAAGIDLKLDLDDGSDFERRIRFPFPFERSRTLLKLINLDLIAHPPPAPIKALALRLVPTLPRVVQEGLLTPLSPEPDKLEVTLARIRALVGEGNLGVPQLLNTHRPDAFLLQPLEVVRGLRAPTSISSDERQKLAFRFFRPALPADVSIWLDRPQRVSAHGIRSKVVTASGPWRASGGWWTNIPWDRDEWDIELANGNLYRLCREPDGSWKIEGAYD